MKTFGHLSTLCSEGIMDKEERHSTFGNESSMDADELLKDLEDDEEEDAYSEMNEAVGTSSFVRMLSTSTDSLANMQTIRDIQPVPQVAIKSKAEQLAEDAESLAKEAEDSADKLSEELKSMADNADKLTKDVSLTLERLSDDSNKNSIRPFISPIKPASSLSGERIAIPEKLEIATNGTMPSSPSATALPPTPPTASIEDAPTRTIPILPTMAAVPPTPPAASAEDAQGRATLPPPPPMPMPSMVSKARLLREGEQAYTQDQLKDILAGGKNDEAPDLAALKVGDNGWYTQIFNEDYLRTIPKSEPRQTRREARFIIDRLGLEPGARVLDLACGTGRHAIELARQGYDMVGLDLSMVMLKRALSEAQNAKQVIKFIHGDMQKLTFKAIFDAVYCVQTSFGYFDDLRNFRVLQGIYRALKPNGVFLIETINRDFLIDELPLRLWWKGKDCKLLEELDLEHMTGILRIKRSFVFEDPSRAPWEQNINIRLYTSHELRALLMRAGFSVAELSGDYSLPGAFFGATSPRIIYVAEKLIK